jgi:hypothetical protein
MNSESPATILPTPPGMSMASLANEIDAPELDGLDLTTPFEFMNATSLPGHGATAMSAGFHDIDWDVLLSFSGLAEENAVLATNVPTTAQAFTEASSSAPKENSWNFTEGLHLQQIDSVEAKCVELRTYMAGFQTGIDHSVLSKYTTRDRLVDCVQLYAKCYQPIQPIIHLPTFDLAKSPPDLLVAMMLVGACYSDNLIPATNIVQGAIHMLLVLQSSSVSCSL